MTASGHSTHRHDATASLNRTAFMATLHCLTGCAVGEVLGMVIGTALGWGAAATIALAVVLAFVFGFSLTTLPLLRAGLGLAVALPLAFASDSLSIAVMEIVDNGVMLALPGAMDATLTSPLFWDPIRTTRRRPRRWRLGPGLFRTRTWPTPANEPAEAASPRRTTAGSRHRR